MKKPQLSGFSALSSSQFNDPTKGELYGDYTIQPHAIAMLFSIATLHNFANGELIQTDRHSGCLIIQLLKCLSHGFFKCFEPLATLSVILTLHLS